MSEKTTMKEPMIDIICSVCKCKDVVRDATAAWNIETQDWELAGVQDQGYCNECEDSEVDLEEVPILGPEKPTNTTISLIKLVQHKVTDHAFDPIVDGKIVWLTVDKACEQKYPGLYRWMLQNDIEVGEKVLMELIWE
jgi:hypothetical protein